MIYAIARQLGAALAAQKVPFPVVFGPESNASLSDARERIVIEQPMAEKRDAIEAPIATHPNPRMPMRRLQAVRIRIFARANFAGATWHDHAERAEEVLDHVVAELDAIVKGRRNVISYGAGGFVSLVDAQGSGTYGGATYELDLSIDRGIFRRTWALDAAGEVTIGVDVAITNTIKVSNALGAAGTPPAGAEIASGG